MDEVHFEHAPIDRLRPWQQQRTLYFRLHPLYPAGAAWMAGKGNSRRPKEIMAQDTVIFQQAIELLLMDDDAVALAKASVPVYEELLAMKTMGRVSDDALHRLLTHYTNSIPRSSPAYAPALLFRALHVDEDYLRWLNVTDPSPSQHEGREIMTTRPPCAHPDFWSYLRKAVLRGLNSTAVECLRHCGLKGQEVSLLVSLLQGDRHDRAWRGRVIQASKTADAELRGVYEILRGDRDAIYAASDSFFELLVCLYTWSAQSLTMDEALQIAHEESSVDETLASEYICEKLFQQDYTCALLELSAVEVGVAGHLAAFAESMGLLEDFTDVDIPLSLCDNILLSYIDRLLSQPHPGAWRLTIAYCQNIPDGMAYFCEAVVHVCPDEQSIEQILEICADHMLVEQGASITAAWAKRLEASGEFGSALLFHERACNVSAASALVYRLFEASLRKGAITGDVTLQKLLASPFSMTADLAKIVDPLGRLHEYYGALHDGNRIAAAKSIVQLIKVFNGDKLLFLLYGEILPFLALDQPRCITLEDLYVLLAELHELGAPEETAFQSAVEELEHAVLLRDKAWKHDVKNASDFIQHLRMSIAKEVARSYLQEQ